MKLNSLHMQYISSQFDTKLDVIKDAKIYIKAPNLTEKLIATALNNTNPDTITFTVANEELLEYFRTSQNSLIFEIQGRRLSADQITLKINSGFNVKVQL